MAAAAGTLMAGASASQGVASIGSAIGQAQALKAQSDYASQMAAINTRLANRQARDVIRNGDDQADDVKKQANQIIGSQRASYAAQGVEVDSGSAAQVQESTAAQAAVDAEKIKMNAWRQAWGIKMNNVVQNTNAQVQAIGSRAQASNSLVTGGLQFATSGLDAYAKYKKG